MLSDQPRIAILSSREKHNYVFNSCLYEFEDIIAEVDNVDFINLAPATPTGKFTQRVVKKSGQYLAPLTKVSPPFNQKVSVEKEYDILFIILDFPYNVIDLNLVQEWRKKSKIAVCYVIELWKTELKKYHNYLTFLRDFDFVFLGHSQIVPEVQDIIKKPCAYLAPGVDAIKFRPNSVHKERCIDICSMGRRSSVTHEALLRLTQKREFFYHYDVLNNADKETNNHQAHRIFNSNILKNSRYFIAHHAKVNCLDQTGGQIEIGYRFFEGAAAGAVLLGKPPQNSVFERYFGWENAVIKMNFDEPDIDKIIDNLDNQPELLTKISSDNVKYSLLQHDWVYRWLEVLKQAGLTPTEKLEQRTTHLQKLANSFTLSSC